MTYIIDNTRQSMQVFVFIAVTILSALTLSNAHAQSSEDEIVAHCEKSYNKYTKVFDCECIADEYYDAKSKDPLKQRQSILLELTGYSKPCRNYQVMRDNERNVCISSPSFSVKSGNKEDYCTCYADTWIKSFKETTYALSNIRRELKRRARRACNKKITASISSSPSSKKPETTQQVPTPSSNSNTRIGKRGTPITTPPPSKNSARNSNRPSIASNRNNRGRGRSERAVDPASILANLPAPTHTLEEIDLMVDALVNDVTEIEKVVFLDLPEKFKSFRQRIDNANSRQEKSALFKELDTFRKENSTRQGNMIVELSTKSSEIEHAFKPHINRIGALVRADPKNAEYNKKYKSLTQKNKEQKARMRLSYQKLLQTTQERLENAEDLASR